MSLIIIILRTIGIAAVVALVVLLVMESRGTAFQVIGWTSIIAFGLSFILQMIKSLLPVNKV